MQPPAEVEPAISQVEQSLSSSTMLRMSAARAVSREVKIILRIASMIGRASKLLMLTVEDWRRNADRERTDSGVRLRPATWYKARLLRHFRPIGGGLMVRRGFNPLLWELERPW